ncbi:electron transport complex subunit RsxA [Rhodoferax antarcticus]|uniref:Ion-translocating oxidoreductase complex subunit A n=1 Tax=Rhodoferax antarcticus ANT.BR TaxID=1111071 RepID=A0A1Q8YFN9_9BURK|nr:electron transport complex subunit RsxA [Rhodoferax antarcticus]APW45435.1 electron transport complex subunit RsxA [Rhodoferax antarcticus]MCW2312705.1 electron transport complex protein RnfA [Rhodoferax antarcticus]OLP06868.1 electron transport complex protein rnfA [Rhodoferax antarcticus ANT.BR]
MQDVFLVLLGTAIVNNVVLAKFLGLCPFMGTSSRIETALGMAMATTFVLTLSTGFVWVVEAMVLAPLDLAFLRTMTFILVIAAVVQFTEMLIRRISLPLYEALGVYLPLITTNCAVLGVALLMVQAGDSFAASMLSGFGTALGFGLVLVIFAGLRERLALGDVPKVFEGAPIGFITAGVLSLAFMGFAGLGGH